MHLENLALRSSIYVFIMVALFGCAVPASKPDANKMATEVYYPVIQPGKTWRDAANDLLNILREGKWVWADTGNTSVQIKCAIINNKIELLSQNEGRMVSSFYIYQLLDHPIVLEGIQPSYIALPGLIKLRFSDKMINEARKAADAFYFFQQDVKNYRDLLDRQLTAFEPMAAEYRSLKSKPKMSEEQRKLIVQANALTGQKQYFEAREKYRRAVELDPLSYPGAYFNLALLEAQMNLPFAAITYMKQYLLIAAEAKDARSAQDKIYEWELLMTSTFTREITTNVSTEPPDAFLEFTISDSGMGWAYHGRAPGVLRFLRNDPKQKSCLIRVSKPGYSTEERSFPFESLPQEVRISLRKSDSGQDSHGYLGIRFKQITEEKAKPLGLTTLNGIWVEEIMKGSPAERAGLKPDDIILTFNGNEIKERIDLPRMTASTPIGGVVDLGIFRNGQAHTVKVIIDKLPK